MADTVVGFLPGVLELSGWWIKRHLSYTFKFRRKICDLGEKLDQLDRHRECLQHIIDEALRQGDEIRRYVKDWQTRCDRIVEEARAHLNKAENQQNHRCCRNLKRQWQIGRQAAKKSQGIAKLLEEKATFGPVSFRPPFQPIVRPPAFVPPSRAETLNLIIGFLRDPKSKRVGIHGMGGVGKTFMVGELMREVKKRELFDKVVMVVVSHAPNINKIRIEIAGQLDLNLHESENVSHARLSNKLAKETRVLIILDDLWKPLELDKVGFPDENNLKEGTKILLVSRRKDVLEKMDSSTLISLELLSVDEGRDLFNKKVGGIHDLDRVEQIVRKCDGHPLSLAAMGDLLKNKGSHVWDDIINQLSNIPGELIQDKVLSILELSYNYLTEEQKSVFLLCGLLGQAQISSLVVFKYCWGLALFSGVHRVVEAWDRLRALIDNLVDTSLVISFNKDDALIKIHDIVRDTATFIASKNQKAFTIKSDSDLESLPENSLTHSCPWIFLLNCDVCELPRILECPNLKLFILETTSQGINIPNCFFQMTTNLQVLALSKITTMLPTSLELLKNLRTLCLHDCILSDLTFIGSLEKMVVLSFRGSNFHRVPKELRKLKRLKVLDLHNCKWLTSFPEMVLSSLSQLEELYMGHTSVEWDSPGNASLSELESLYRLTTVEIQFPAGKTIPDSVVCGNLERYRIGFTRKNNFDRFPAGMNTLLFPTGSILPKDLKILLAKTESLRIESLRGIRNAHFGMKADVLDNLRHLCILLADDLEHVVCSTDSDLHVFPKLEILTLRNMKRLKNICTGQLSTGSLSRLKTLILFKCDNLRYVFSLAITKCLNLLETLDVRACLNIEKIIHIDENDPNIAANHLFELPKLINLFLWVLPRLRCFIGTETSTTQHASTEFNEIQPLFDNKVLLPLLESLDLFNLPKVGVIWTDQLGNGSFTKLRHLTIHHCHDLQTVFQAAISKRFMDLSKLELSCCQMLKEIYVFPGEEQPEEKEIAVMESKLAYISLNCMPNFESIWRNRPPESLRFQCLESISITDCQSLKAVFTSSIATQLTQLKELHLHNIGNTEIVSRDNCRSSPPYFSVPKLTSLKIEFFPDPDVLRRENSELQASTILSDPHRQQFNAMLLTDNVFRNLAELSINGNLLKLITESSTLINLVSKVRSLVLFTFEDDSLIASNILAFSRLEKLCILDSKIKNIFINDMNHGHGEGSLMHPFDPLRSLKLDNVTYIETLTLTDPFVTKLENLELHNCCDVMCISTAYFQNLSSLSIDRCDKMVAVLPFSIAITMDRLVKMSVRYCSSLKEVVCADDGQLLDAEPQSCITFRRLKILVLEQLSSLSSFCSAKFMFQFPALEDVTVEGCPNMEVFSRETISTPKLKNVFGATWQCAADLNSTISQLFTEMVGFRLLEEITLSKCPQLAEKWHGELGFKLSAALQKVVIDNCVSSQASVPLKHFADAITGWRLIIENCESIEEVFHLEGTEASETRAVTLIYMLKLCNVPNLRNTWNIAPGNILRFELLQSLYIEKCDRLTNVFTLPSASCLSNLGSLVVRDCASVSVIVKRGAEEETDWDGHTLFPSLNILLLSRLPSLSSFYESDRALKVQSLTIIGVFTCPNLTVFDTTRSDNTQRLFNGQVEIGRRLEDIQISVE